MKNRKVIKALSVSLGVVLGAGSLAVFAGCGGTESSEYLVIMSEELDGLFNPFYATTGPDMDIVGMTQIGMLSTGYEGAAGAERATVAYGDNEPVVVKDYEVETVTEGSNTYTDYTFVIKNGITFSDGKPLTMNDVMFNLYVYLDPVYTGSSTMYSTDIVGLQEYRTQRTLSGDTDEDTQLSQQSTNRANNRIKELVNLFQQVGKTTTAGTYEADEATMRAAISTHSVSSGYKNAVATAAEQAGMTDADWQAQLLEDYNYTLEKFREELESDYASAKDSYTEAPYKGTEFDNNPVLCFMYAEGFVELEYGRKPDGSEDKNNITRIIKNYNTNIATEEAAIQYVYDSRVTSELHYILQYYATAGTLQTEYAAQARDVILHENLKDGELSVKNISGIQSLGHTSDIQTVNVNGTDYTVAHQHNADGTVANANEYDVLRIRINGVDPKAIWNFGFTVAPQHYYAPNQTVDIANNQFGVVWGSFDFMRDEIQSSRNQGLPMGAGPYKVTDSNNGDNVTDGNAFYRDNVVYFKANDGFLLGAPKTQYVRYQVVSSSNALNALERGQVHFVTPQYTIENYEKIQGMKSQGIESAECWQLGYGYIGINAGKVPNINIRKAIMSAMDISLALEYYMAGTAQPIYWPMSTVSWAYPRDGQGNPSTNNGHDYTMFQGDAMAEQKIRNYMALAGVSEGDPSLSIKFTIAGSNLTEHPTYNTFQKAADLLNACGWDIEVVPDMLALTKLSTGSLAVWAAAWGSTVDPDMYQVYHKNSTATSVYSWGYREIKASPTSYPEETTILNELSALIDDAREINDEATRTDLYEEAMGKVLDLAVELPVYQRKELFAYNANVIKKESLPEVINPYSSPLAKIWEIELV